MVLIKWSYLLMENGPQNVAVLQQKYQLTLIYDPRL